MSQYPEQVQQLDDALRKLPGVTEVDFDIRGLQDIEEGMLSLPGEFGDLPHLVLRRTKGGLENEILVSAKIRFTQDRAGWIAVELLAWWVRDLSRSGEWVQMRPLALPPIAYGTQLGRTLTFVIEFFFINPTENNDPVLEKIAKHADSLNGNLEDYAEALANPTQFAQDDLETLKRCANLGDAAAQYRLALCYERGEGVPEDPVIAFNWFKRSADKHYPYALLSVGYCCAYGRGVPRKNPEEAFAYFQQAAETGLADAQCRLGYCYLHGIGAEQDREEAVAWFTKAAEQEQPEAMRWLGRCYAQGAGVEADLAKAVEYYRGAAEADDEMAMGFLGECYVEGQGVDKDVAMGVDWYRRGAEGGDMGCQAEYGNCFYEGKLVAQDFHQALFWFQKALDQGLKPVAGVVAELKAKVGSE